MIHKYNRWVILVASFLLNVSIGGIYAWSIYTEPLTKLFGWNAADLALVFSLNVGLSFIPYMLGDLLQRIMGVRLCILLGGLLAGFGYFASGYAQSLLALYVTYGILMGFGFNIANSALMTNLVKFFPDRSGLAIGSVLAGIGLSSIVIAPAAAVLMDYYGVLRTFRILGAAMSLLVCFFTLFIRNAPEGYRPEGMAVTATGSGNPAGESREYNLRQILSRPGYYLFIVMYFAGIFTGLMIISSASPMGQSMYMLSPGAGALVVGAIAVCNGVGRIFGGDMVWRLGFEKTLPIIYIIIFTMLMILLNIRDTTAFVTAMMGIGLTYGMGIAVLPTTIKKEYGQKHFGINYGFSIAAYSLIAVVAPRVIAYIKTNNNGDYTKAFQVGIATVLAGLGLSVFLGIRRKREKAMPEKEKIKKFLDID